jgi:hypothetical protein
MVGKLLLVLLPSLLKVSYQYQWKPSYVDLPITQSFTPTANIRHRNSLSQRFNNTCIMFYERSRKEICQLVCGFSSGLKEWSNSIRRSDVHQKSIAADVALRHVSPHLKKKKKKNSKSSVKYTHQPFSFLPKSFSPQSFPPSLHLLPQPHRPPPMSPAPSIASYPCHRYV